MHWNINPFCEEDECCEEISEKDEENEQSSELELEVEMGEVVRKEKGQIEIESKIHHNHCFFTSSQNQNDNKLSQSSVNSLNVRQQSRSMNQKIEKPSSFGLLNANGAVSGLTEGYREKNHCNGGNSGRNVQALSDIVSGENKSGFSYGVKDSEGLNRECSFM